MTDDSKVQPDMNPSRDPVKSGEMGQKSQQSHAGTSDPPRQRVPQGRRPLFRQ